MLWNLPEEAETSLLPDEHLTDDATRDYFIKNFVATEARDEIQEQIKDKTEKTQVRLGRIDREARKERDAKGERRIGEPVLLALPDCRLSPFSLLCILALISAHIILGPFYLTLPLSSGFVSILCLVASGVKLPLLGYSALSSIASSIFSCSDSRVVSVMCPCQQPRKLPWRSSTP